MDAADSLALAAMTTPAIAMKWAHLGGVFADIADAHQHKSQPLDCWPSIVEVCMRAGVPCVRGKVMDSLAANAEKELLRQKCESLGPWAVRRAHEIENRFTASAATPAETLDAYQRFAAEMSERAAAKPAEATKAG